MDLAGLPEPTLDLNRPADAKEYVALWIAAGMLTSEDQDLPSLIKYGTAEDHLRLAKKLFMYGDTREPLGRYDQPH